MAKHHSCKLGSQPALIVLRYNYKIEVGKIIIFREHDSHGYSSWRKGRIWMVYKDGYFFISWDLKVGEEVLARERQIRISRKCDDV